MNPVLQFVASLVDSLIWPAVLLVLALVFRTRVEALIDNIVSIRIGDKQVAFARSLDAAGEQAKKVADADTSPQPEPVELDQAAKAFRATSTSSTASPRAAIIECWLVVQNELNAAIERLGLSESVTGQCSTVRTVPLLRSSGYLNDDWVGLIHHLRSLRNEAAHDLRFDISPDQADEYYDLCLYAVHIIQALGAND